MEKISSFVLACKGCTAKVQCGNFVWGDGAGLTSCSNAAHDRSPRGGVLYVQFWNMGCGGCRAAVCGRCEN